MVLLFQKEDGTHSLTSISECIEWLTVGNRTNHIPTLNGFLRKLGSAAAHLSLGADMEAKCGPHGVLNMILSSLTYIREVE